MIENPQVGDTVKVVSGYNTGSYGRITRVYGGIDFVDFYDITDGDEFYNVSTSRLIRIKYSEYLSEKLKEANEEVRSLEDELERTLIVEAAGQ